MSIYRQWIFNCSINDNFSFEDDSDGNGLADNLTDVSGTHSRTEEGIRFHIQKTNGSFYLEQIIDNTKNYRIYFDYKVTGTTSIIIDRYNNAGQYVDTWKDENLTDTEWNYKEYAYTANAEVIKLKITFSCDSGLLYLDNLAIIENSTNILINPTTFGYGLVSKAETVETIDNTMHFIEPYKNKYIIENLTPLWALINYEKKLEVDNLINEKILIRTHDKNVFTAKVIGINWEYKHYVLELEQMYGCSIELKYY